MRNKFIVKRILIDKNNKEGDEEMNFTNENSQKNMYYDKSNNVCENPYVRERKNEQ